MSKLVRFVCIIIILNISIKKNRKSLCRICIKGVINKRVGHCGISVKFKFKHKLLYVTFSVSIYL